MTTRLTTHLAISMIRNILLILLFPLLMQAQSSKVIAYYQAYGYGNGQDPWQIDFRNMTHLIHIDGGATDYNPNTAPYWNVKATASDSVHLFWFNGRNMVDSLVNRAHAAGVKVLICLGAGGSSTSFESDSAKNEVMANAVVDFAKRHNYDGVDVDWETDNQTQAFNERLLRLLRRRMDNTWGSYRTRGLICFTPAFDHNTASGGMLIRPMWQGLIDWIQPQAYDLNTPWTQETNGCVYSFDQCVYPPNPATWPSLNKWQPSWDGVRIGVTGNRSPWAGPAYLAAQGWSKSKLVYGFKSYGYGTTGTTAFQGARNCGDRGSESNLDFMQLALTRGGTRRYDDSSKGLYINGTATSAINAYGFTVGSGQTFIASIEDSVSMKEKTKFVKNNGYGGMMYYDIFWGYDDPAVGGSYIAGQAQPLLYIMNRELNGTSVVSPTMTVAPTSRSFGNVTINTTSSEQTYTVSGSNLTPTSGNITVTAPTGFQVSKSTGSGFASSLTYTCIGGQLTSTTVYMRFQPTAVQSYSGSVTSSGGGASTQYVAVTGTCIAATTPTLTVSPSSRTFGNVVVNTTSTELTYTINGSNLTPASGNITITPPSGYQVSVTSGSGFASSLNVSYTSSTLSSRTIYIRFSPTAVQSYTGNITNSGGGTTAQNVAVTGAGVAAATPTLTVSPLSRAFGNVTVSTTSAESTYTVSGSNLTPASGNITVTAPTGFQVSKSSGSGFASSVACAFTGSALSAATIYVRFMPTAAQSYSGNVTNAGGGATTKNVTVSGTGISATTPMLTVNPTSRTFGSVIINTTSGNQTYTLTGSMLSPASGNITVTAPTGFRISKKSGSGFASTLTYSYTGGLLTTKTVYVRFQPTAVQSYSGNISHAGGGATTKNVAVTGTGTSVTTSILTVSPSSITFGNAIVNTISSNQSYSLSGSTLSPASGNITVTAPTGFQISKSSGSGFASTLTYAYTGGLLTSNTVYVRFQPTAVQSYSGNITHAGGGATTTNTAVTGSGVSITGTLSVAPQTLPSGGGTVTLTWTSQNATSASIDQGIGTVSLNSSTSVSVTSTKTFTLTLNNGTSSVQFSSTVQVSVPSDQVSAEVIYKDVALASTWTDVRSWNITCNYSSTSPLNQGSSSILLSTTQWGGLQFTKGTWGSFTLLDPAKYDSLSFAIHGGTTGATINVSCINDDYSEQKTAVSFTVPANSWIVKKIPMIQLAATSFTAIQFTGSVAQSTFSLDELRLVLKPNQTPAASILEFTKAAATVQLTSFIGIARGNTAELTWKTATEVNSNTFQIERRVNAQWQKVGELPAAGTSNITQEYTYVDNLNNVNSGNILYRINTLYKDGSAQYSAEVEVVSLPNTFSLEQNYPNPFNPSTEIGYQLSTTAEVQLIVYDILGKEIVTLVNQVQQAGHYTVTFHANNLASGLYYARLHAEGKVQIRKMMLTK